MESERQAPVSGSGDAARSTPGGFLRAFRRRSLLIVTLRLALLAAVANEAVRWASLLSNILLGTQIPFLNIGPFLLLTTALFAARKWTWAGTASAADRALRFSDRLLSWVDFSSRPELPAAVVRAQEDEVSSSLSGVRIGALLPLNPLLLGAPLLLFGSVFYPNLFKSEPFVPNMFQTATVGPPPSPSPREAPSSAPGDQEPPGIHGSGTLHPAREAAEAEAGAESGTPPQAETPVAAGDPAKEQGEGATRRPPAVLESDLEEGPLVSKTVGSELSPVVDPLFNPSGPTADATPELPGGTISFRLIPRAASGEGGGEGNSSAEAPAGNVVINLDDVPERYRSIVMGYFALLAEGSQGGPSPEQGKEHP